MALIRPRLCKSQKRCTRFTATSDKVYQLLAHGWWLSPGTPAFSTTKTGRHDIAEILLKVALKHQKSNKKINQEALGGQSTVSVIKQLILAFIPQINLKLCSKCSGKNDDYNEQM
jgi:hypothetical protein